MNCVLRIMNHELKKGDKIAIITPATVCREEYIDGAADYIRRRGYVPVIMPHAKGPADGTYAAPLADRVADLTAAIEDPEIKAILCSRGGFGCIHLVDKINLIAIDENPKWIIGFSDISILHALWQSRGIMSLHSSMAKQLTLHPDAPETEGIFAVLEGKEDLERPEIFTSADGEVLIPGEAEGILTGGNLAVLNGLANTPLDILAPHYLKGKILFLEDVGEKIYQVDRMLTRLYLAGALHAVEGLIFGEFTEYQPDKNFSSMEEMISTRLKEWDITCPTLLHASIGHIDRNRPVVIGRKALLSI